MVLVDRGVITKPTFERPSRIIVLHAKALMVHEISVIGFGYKIDLDDSARRQNDLAEPGVEPNHIRSGVKISLNGIQHIRSLS